MVWLGALLSITVAARGAGGPADGKIDEGLDDARQVDPVFVRMTDQLIGGQGEYDRFCREHDGARRRELRPKIIATLKADRVASFLLSCGVIPICPNASRASD